MAPSKPVYDVDWIYSKKSNIHIATDAAWFTNYKPLTTHIDIKTEDSSSKSLQVIGIGDVQLDTKTFKDRFGGKYQRTLKLKNVLHAPESVCNIIGAPLLDDHHMRAFLPLDMARIYQNSNGELVGFLDVRGDVKRLRLRFQKFHQSSLGKDSSLPVGLRWPSPERRRCKDGTAASLEFGGLNINGAELSGGAELFEGTEPSEGVEPSEGTELPEGAELSKDVEPTEDAELSDGFEPSENAEASEGTEAFEGVEHSGEAELSEGVKPFASIMNSANSSDDHKINESIMTQANSSEGEDLYGSTTNAVVSSGGEEVNASITNEANSNKDEKLNMPSTDIMSQASSSKGEGEDLNGSIANTATGEEVNGSTINGANFIEGEDMNAQISNEDEEANESIANQANSSDDEEPNPSSPSPNTTSQTTPDKQQPDANLTLTEAGIDRLLTYDVGANQIIEDKGLSVDDPKDHDEIQHVLFTRMKEDLINGGHDQKVIKQTLQRLLLHFDQEQEQGKFADGDGSDSEADSQTSFERDLAQNPASHVADRHFSDTELDWIKEHHQHSGNFLMWHGLKPFDDDDCREGKAIVQAKMHDSDDEDESRGDAEDGDGSTGDAKDEENLTADAGDDDGNKAYEDAEDCESEG